MLRSALGVIAGYIVMGVAVIASFSIAFMALGVDRAFAAGTFYPGAIWIALSLVVSLAAAIAGGGVCARVGRGSPRALWRRWCSCWGLLSRSWR